ncbi:hypothetical protein JAAARDRAFT_420382 [Jaapia argillacea MUCL 33604]|uniref:Uncharacterized protein n=1 Tax=Jaapia argillacea MUCL 33604 TaxID=933084 RepID=A0A067PFH8_9AGAM|nr:hypothetical protein JAAARDRAFT_420382 [Jaapia argillacea MUCL 33604]
MSDSTPETLSLESIYPDPDLPLPILIIVTPADPSSNTPVQWKLSWQVAITDTGDQVQRQLYITPDDGTPKILTTVISPTHPQDHVVIKSLGLSDRRLIEVLATGPVGSFLKSPDGKWDSERWLKVLLVGAHKRGLFTHHEWTSATKSASEIS